MKTSQILDMSTEITKAVVWLSLICTNPSLLLTEAFIRKVNHIVKEKEPLINSSIYRESYIIQGLNFKNRVNHKNMKFLNDFF